MIRGEDVHSLGLILDLHSNISGRRMSALTFTCLHTINTDGGGGEGGRVEGGGGGSVLCFINFPFVLTLN